MYSLFTSDLQNAHGRCTTAHMATGTNSLRGMMIWPYSHMGNWILDHLERCLRCSEEFQAVLHLRVLVAAHAAAAVRSNWLPVGGFSVYWVNDHD